MNCPRAREVINCLLDGEEHELADQAKTHMSECPDCREWHASMHSALRLMETARDCVPAIDVADLVAARLPTQHPGGMRPSFALISARGLWTYATLSWLVGAVVLAAAVLIVCRVAGVELSALSAGAVCAEVCGWLASALKLALVFVGALGRVVAGMRNGAADLGGLQAAVVTFLIFDTLVWVLFAALWRLRRRRLMSTGLLA